MARYLSQAWFDEVNEAVRSSPALAEAALGSSLAIQQVVTGGPDGDLRYWLRIAEGSVELGLGDVAGPDGGNSGPDATVTQSYETAVAVHRGDLRAEDAILGGRIRLRGDMAALIRHQAALSELGDAVAEARDRTEYP